MGFKELFRVFQRFWKYQLASVFWDRDNFAQRSPNRWNVVMSSSKYGWPWKNCRYVSKNGFPQQRVSKGDGNGANKEQCRYTIVKKMHMKTKDPLQRTGFVTGSTAFFQKTPQTELFCACGYQELLAYIYMYIYIFVHNLTNYDLNSLANKIANNWQFYCANIGFFIENIIGQICLTHFDSTLFIPHGQPPLSQTSSGTRG